MPSHMTITDLFHMQYFAFKLQFTIY